MAEELKVTGARKWWVYQAERFPVLAHGPLVVAFSSSAVCFSALLRGSEAFPPLTPFLVAFVTCLLFFLQLRIADEFKDFEEDSEFRPYRAVPRGLVSLRELAVVFCIGAGIQLALALWLHRPLFFVLLVAWTYLALMSKEFFVRVWITKRPITYLWTHMLIMPIVDFYATSCDWLPVAGTPPDALFWFLIVSFFNGIVIEIGRKLRAEEQEEEGVQTYTRLWGTSRAPWVWFACLTVTGTSAFVAAVRIDFAIPVAVVLALLLGGAVTTVWKFTHSPTAKTAKLFEPISAVWTLLMYLMLGLVPMAAKVFLS
jgi:4-hydroxybenzoate polyprenyltransferase